MEKLTMTCERQENGKKEQIFKTFDKESIINWTITALYDGAVKRCKIKIDQYYADDHQEYCKIRATYTRHNQDYNEKKEIYTIKNWCNEWGNFINPQKTFKTNNITIESEDQ